MSGKSSSGVDSNKMPDTFDSSDTTSPHTSHADQSPISTALGDEDMKRQATRDRNYNRYPMKRPPMTISSHTKKFKKKKIGFDPEQCGFIRINDIILSISGNVSQTYEQMSGNSSDKNPVFFKDLTFSKKQGPDFGASMKSSSAKDKRGNDCVSEALASYLRAGDLKDSKKGPLNTQVKELDEVVDQPPDCSTFSPQDGLLTPPPAKVTKKDKLVQELKRWGFREVNKKSSLFEMIVPGNTETSDRVTKIKSFHNQDITSDDEENKLARVWSNISNLTYESVLTTRQSRENLQDSGRSKSISPQKKLVSIKDKDGTVHIPRENRTSKVDTKENTGSYRTSLTLSIPPITVKTSLSGSLAQNESSESLIQTEKKNGSITKKYSSSVVANLTTVPSTTDSLRSNTSSDSTKGSRLPMNNNYTQNNSVGELSHARSTNLTESAVCTGSINYKPADMDMDVWLLQCELCETRHQVETLRQENEDIKRENQCLQAENLQFPSEQTMLSVPHGCIWAFPSLLHVIIAILVGIIIGMFVI